MKITKLFLFGMLGAFFLNSCSSDDDNITPEPIPEGNYTEGFFVLNEGSTTSAGTVSFVSDDFQVVEREIYAAVNEDNIGQYAQSMFFTDDLAFIIGGGSNMITVVDRYTFELIGKVETGLQGPRYGTVVDGKAYVTNHAVWDNYTDDYLVVIDVETLEIEDTIVIGDIAETVIAEGGLLYIQSAAFGSGQKISVFNPATKSIERIIETNEGLNDFEVYENNIFALSSGGLKVRDLGSGELISEITFSEDLTGSEELDVENDIIYYTINSDVYTVGIDATEPAESPIITNSGSETFSGLYGFEVEDGQVYVADHGDYSSNSSVYIYTTGGELLEEIGVGIAPNGFYFND